MFEVDPSPQVVERQPVTAAELDALLTAQMAVAWAGEKGEEARLGWWRTDLVSEFGGEDLFGRLLPHTWRWAVLQAVREAARRRDAELRAKHHAPDNIVSLFRLGFELDEQIDERLQDHKRSGLPPKEALPGLAEVIAEEWDRKAFARWLERHGSFESKVVPLGRRLKGRPPKALEGLADALLAALSPLAEDYPLPHFLRGSK